MDRSLDEIISERPQRGGRRGDRRAPTAPRGPRREEYPRDGVRKVGKIALISQNQIAYSIQNRGDDRGNIDTDWVHDRFEEDRNDRRNRRSPEYDDRYGPPRPDPRTSEAGGAKLRVDNLHYELTEEDINELFSRIGRVASARLLYDRQDRSQGTAFVTYADPRDARQALREFDGANANGQPIRIKLLPDGPAADGPSGRGGSLFDRVEAPGKSLFDRIEGGRNDSRDGDRRRRGGRGERSFSPRKGGDRLRVPGGGDLDRYIPGGRDSRSPMGRPREQGRRPGARREESGRGGRGGRGGRPRADEEGRPAAGRRTKKTAEELDAEMEDYWGDKASGKANGSAGHNGDAGAATVPATNVTQAPAGGDDDIDMIE